MKKSGEAVRAFIMRNVEDRSKGLVARATGQFGISRQAVHKHLRLLVDAKVLSRAGHGGYELCTLEDHKKILAVTDGAPEDIVWRTEIRDMMGDLPENALDIWCYGFTQMFNNVVAHSESESAFVQVKKTAFSTKMILWDRGVGIFDNIRSHMNLLDERHAVLELTKGKLTTDPAAHSGQGIFFTTRAFDTFSILSGGVFLSHACGETDDWTLETQQEGSGTLITMTLRNDTSRCIKDIYDTFPSDKASGFSTTVVPAHLAQCGTEKLVSRSEAKRLLERTDCFETVLVDFGGVESIGEAFADEIFRVFAKDHPEVEIREVRARREVQDVIEGVRKVNLSPLRR
ncbi:MAG: STAS-like domain-containing protein [Syntrophorhabdaceae bacterium]|nr:STAS-like domain-containing protein [Syntrophorhabdaceae bacterium]